MKNAEENNEVSSASALGPVPEWKRSTCIHESFRLREIHYGLVCNIKEFDPENPNPCSCIRSVKMAALSIYSSEPDLAVASPGLTCQLRTILAGSLIDLLRTMPSS